MKKKTVCPNLIYSNLLFWPSANAKTNKKSTTKIYIILNLSWIQEITLYIC